MAHCEKIQSSPTPPPPSYQLDLNEQEARLLRRLLYSHVAGAGAGPLFEVDAALMAAGVLPAEQRGRWGITRSGWNTPVVVFHGE
jgi:hypothetical protein